MRTLLGLILVTLVGCVINNGSASDPKSGSGSGSDPGGVDTAICGVDNECACPTNEKCVYDCTPDAPVCHVQGAPDQAVNVKCDNDGDCHVECSQATSCEVDCGNSPDCHVTCPATGCQVTGCDPAAGCQVSCGIAIPASLSGTTATCP